MAANIQLKRAEQLRIHSKISSDISIQNPRFFTKSRLDGKNRYFSSLFPCECIREPQKVLETYLQPKTNADDLSTFRTKLGSKCIRFDYSVDCANPQRQGNTRPYLFGRFSPSKSIESETNKSSSIHSALASRPRLASKHDKINLRSSNGTRIPGYNVESLEQPQNVASKKDRKYKERSYAQFNSGKINPHRSTVSSRSPEFRQFCGASGTATHETFAKVHNAIARKRSILPTDSRSENGTPMVVSQLRKSIDDPCGSTYTFSDYRCGRNSLGCSTEQPEFVRNMVSSRETAPQQSQRAFSSTESLTIEVPRGREPNDSLTVRQHVSLSVSPQRRGHEISSTHETDLRNIHHSGPIQYKPNDIPHTGNIQQRSRPSVASHEISGMASPTRNDQDNICQMGSTFNRPVCLTESSRDRTVLHNRSDGQESNLSRCILFQMEIPSSVGISTAVSDAQSTESHERRRRRVPSGSPEMGSCILEAGLEESRPRSTVYNPAPRERSNRCSNATTAPRGQGNDVGNMEVWGWSKELSGWSSDQLSFLKTAWRSSTLRTYKPAWTRWTIWAQRNNVNTYNPSGSDLARFLIDLHTIEKLAYNTILLHKSVVVTMCSSESSKLSENNIVRHALKAISLQHPKSDKAPIWNLDIVVTYLRKVDISTTSLYDASKHTATLLMLCSGRRVHDLTLLCIDPAHCAVNESHVIFLPEFGSKTDSASYRQSGWKLLQNTESLHLDPVFWIKRLMSLSSERRRIAKVNNLFITACGKPRAASRTIIAGWIKTTLTSAGVTATPGSIRAAVASKSWIDNLPIDEILSRGNWRSGNTFAKFYRRQVLSTQDNPINRLFEPTD